MYGEWDTGHAPGANITKLKKYKILTCGKNGITNNNNLNARTTKKINESWDL